MTAIDGAAAPGRPAPNTPRRELALLLRSRREGLQPADVGLPPGSRRRTRGLRREEVAQLAGVSATYYTFLEQARDVRPSPAVLDALARALRLSPVERDQIHVLAHQRLPVDDDGGEAAAEVLAPGMADLVARLDPHPTYVKGRRADVLAANRAARALFTDWPARPPEDRNMLWWVFTAPEARQVYVEWEREAHAVLARFRLVAARRPDDPAFADLIARLHDASPEVRRWWPRHEVLPMAGGTKRLRHPAAGEMLLRHVVLEVADHPDQRLVTFSLDDAAGGDACLAALAATVPRRDPPW
ncbi:MAG TPA: helix-turn-helix transcriptional regulator [Acidimicrobiales bacterium]|nr:helix-turn-helix transcriptional regulator [Acidimicrobiales bacterium]